MISYKIYFSWKEYLLIVILLLSGCSSKNTTTELSKNEYMVMSVLWYQTSAEARALYYQAFNTAQLILDNHLKSNTSKKKRAVIVDIDETVLDNSPYQGKLIKNNQSFPTGWQEWTGLARAAALPGAIDFLNYTDSLGVAIFYVSNRKVATKEGTIKNLKLLGFPQIEEDHFYLKTDESSKEKRRQAITKNHDIVLLIGDNLNDFADVFEKKLIQERLNEVDKLKKVFGKKFIVLPNPMYGEWEGAVYNYDWGLSDEEKNLKRKEVIKSY